MEEFLSILLGIGFAIWAIYKGIEWVYLKITESLKLTFIFIENNLETHIFLFFFILFFSFLYIFNNEEKEGSQKNKMPKPKNREQTKPIKKNIPKKFTKEYYGIKNGMSKIEIKRILLEEYKKYSKQQTSTIGSVIKEAQEHKRAITKLQTELLGKVL